MRSLSRILAIALFLPAAVAHADGFGLNVRAGTLGLGVEAVQRLSAALDLRFGMNGFGYRTSFKYDGVDYDVDQGVAVPTAYLDWRPMQGKFRISAGAAYYNNVLDLKAIPDPMAVYQIGNGSYPGSAIGTLHGKVSYHTGAPYLGFGWDFFPRQGKIGLSLDAGAFYRNRPDVRLTATGAVTPGDLLLEAENIKGDESKVHPLVSLGAAFRF